MGPRLFSLISESRRDVRGGGVWFRGGGACRCGVAIARRRVGRLRHFRPLERSSCGRDLDLTTKTVEVLGEPVGGHLGDPAVEQLAGPGLRDVENLLQLPGREFPLFDDLHDFVVQRQLQFENACLFPGKAQVLKQLIG